MHSKLQNWLFSFGLDKVQTYGAIAVLPLMSTNQASPSYLSLSAALAKGMITISELGEGGRVPNLHVRNDSDLPVLLLDGEEMRGAKQNRIVNTTILVAAKSELVIPVSCTEAGRWHFNSPAFQESGNVLSPKMRSSKLERVNDSLRSNRGYDANQSVVWNEISNLQVSHQIHSGTSAMHDVFTGLAPKLEELSSHFPCLEGQCGIYVEVNGKFAGLDLLSLPAVWKDVHAKIIRSYAIDFLREAESTQKHPGANPDAVFKEICAGKSFAGRSVGLGEDHRFETETLLASALYHEKSIIHLAAYPRAEHEERAEDFTPRRRRVHAERII